VTTVATVASTRSAALTRAVWVARAENSASVDRGLETRPRERVAGGGDRLKHGVRS